MIEHDEKIRQLCKYSDLAGEFRGHRLRWTGEILGKEEIFIMEKIKNSLPESRRPTTRRATRSWGFKSKRM